MTTASILAIALLVCGGLPTGNGQPSQNPPVRSASDLTPEMRGVIMQLLDAMHDTIATDMVEQNMDALCSKAVWCKTDSIADCDTNLIGTNDRDSRGCDSVGTNSWLRFDSQFRHDIHMNPMTTDDGVVVQLMQYPWGGDHSELFLRNGVNGDNAVPIARSVGDAGSFDEMYIYRSYKRLGDLKLGTVYRVENKYEGDSLMWSNLTVLFTHE